MMAWMVWTLVVSAALGASAALAEGVLRDRGWPTRWAWLGALAASFGLPGWSLLRPSPPPGSASVASDGWIVVDPAWLTDISSVAASAVPTVSERIDTLLLVGWAVSALIVSTVLVVGLTRLSARTGRWRRIRIKGQRVLLSEDFGPAVVGVFAPEIVLPRWALGLPEEGLRLVCLHEAEHRDAGDSWLLVAGALLAALTPWNPVLWWQVRRLRSAVEVDCDARVLRRGASRREYGALLLELGSARSSSPLPVLAWARSRSLLERRLKMIVRNVGKRRPIRSLGAACLSVGLFVVACETPPPTTVDDAASPESESPVQSSFEVREMPSSAGSASTGTFRFHESLEGELLRGVRLFIDGEERDEVPTDLDAAAIERVEVQKTPDGDPSTIHVFTAKEQGEPLIYIDGVRVEGKASALDLAPEAIERVEVLKGEAAESLYGPEAAAGVIRVTLKEEARDVVRK